VILISSCPNCNLGIDEVAIRYHINIPIRTDPVLIENGPKPNPSQFMSNSSN
jgi:hypothetical protein